MVDSYLLIDGDQVTLTDIFLANFAICLKKHNLFKVPASI